MRSRSRFVMVVLLVGVVLAGVWLILIFNQWVSREEFGIYLLEGNQLVISDEDIISYNWTSHEVRLTNNGSSKIEALDVPLEGAFFVVRVGSKEVYNGSFMKPISSFAPPSETIIMTMLDDDTIKIERGHLLLEDQEPRDNLIVFDHFQKMGKLVK